MLSQSETPLIKELIDHLRINHQTSIDLVDYIEQKKFSPAQRLILLAQVNRSEVVGSHYKYEGATLKTVLYLKNH